MPSILLTNFYSECPLNIIKAELPPGFELLNLSKASREELISKAAKAHYLLVGGRIRIDRELLDKAVHLKMIQRTGVGLDSIDLELLKKRNIPLYLNPGINGRSVAEHTLMLILSVLRRLPVADSSLRSGNWLKHEIGVQSYNLFGKTVGLIGLGHIGFEVAKLLQPFGVKLQYYKRTRLATAEELAFNIEYRSFEELLKEVDILSLHCPLDTSTRNLIGSKQIASMKRGCFIINTSRGGLIDERALIEALNSGHVAGAGLDVYSVEPPAPHNDLMRLPNIVLTPHVAGLSLETFERMMREAFQNIKLFEERKLSLLEGKRVRVNV